MTNVAGRRYPLVALASPVSHPPSARHSWSRSGPAARWMAPSTPPPPSSDELAALTMASTAKVVMSPRKTSIFTALLGLQGKKMPKYLPFFESPLAHGGRTRDDHTVVIT